MELHASASRVQETGQRRICKREQPDIRVEAEDQRDVCAERVAYMRTQQDCVGSSKNADFFHEQEITPRHNEVGSPTKKFRIADDLRDDSMEMTDGLAPEEMWRWSVPRRKTDRALCFTMHSGRGLIDDPRCSDFWPHSGRDFRSRLCGTHG